MNYKPSIYDNFFLILLIAILQKALIVLKIIIVPLEVIVKLM